MKYNLPCDVVCDLLPSYVDKLTSSESNIAVEEHLEACEKCKGIYDAMLFETEPDKITIEEGRLMKMTKRKIIAVIVSCVLAFAVLYAGIWTAYKWYTTQDFLTPQDYTLTVNKIDKDEITINTIDGVPCMTFDGIESDYVLRQDLVDLINEQGYVYQLVITSDKYPVDRLYGNVIDPGDMSTSIEVWSNHKSRLKKDKRTSNQLLVFDDIKAVYGFTEGKEDLEKELLWTADE